MALTVKIGRGNQSAIVRLEMDLRKSMNGDLMIFDHGDIDIVLSFIDLFISMLVICDDNICSFSYFVVSSPNAEKAEFHSLKFLVDSIFSINQRSL